MGNQCAGIKDKAKFECIERTRGKPRQSETIYDNEVRLTEDQMSKIAEYHDRFLKNSNPSAILFNFDEDLKEVDKGTKLISLKETSTRFNDDPDSHQENTSARKRRVRNQNPYKLDDIINSNKCEHKRNKSKATSKKYNEEQMDENLKVKLNIDRKENEEEDNNSGADEPASTKQRYEEYPDLSDYCNSFGDPNFHKLNYDELVHNQKIEKRSLREEEHQDVKDNDYSPNGDQYTNEFEEQYRVNGYITPNLGSARSNNYNKYKDSYEDSLEIPENERELIELNNQIVEEARSFVLEGKNKSSSKKKELEYEPNDRILCTEENEDNSFQKLVLDKFDYHRRIATQSSNQDDNIDDFENCSFLKSNNENVFLKLSKTSNNNLIHIVDGKHSLKMVDTSAIELNQSHDYDEFDDILNSLNKGFRQRKTKKSKQMVRSNDIC